MIKKLFKIILKAVLWFFIISIVSVLFFRFFPIPITPLMVIRVVEQKIKGEKVKLKHNWTPLENISKNLQLAVVASEDQNFFIHNGFDLKAIEKAMKNNSKRKKIKGASTISQQTAKNVFLWPSRSYIRKGFEVYFTFLIEMCWSKRRIMEVYLNSIEMGNGIYGAAAATEYWYKKRPSNISQQEAAGIAAILPNPRRYKANSLSPYSIKRRNAIINQMNYMTIVY